MRARHSRQALPATLDPEEIDRFARLASEWWDAAASSAPCTGSGRLGSAFLRDEMVRHFCPGRGRDAAAGGLAGAGRGLRRGLICEPLARLGARVTGLDPAPETIEAARRHAAGQGLAIDYRAGRVEELAAEARTFDAVVCLEVVEHVPDVAAFLKACAALVRPGGLMLLSTLNRTLKAYLLAIIGGEYILRWLPVGTHQWDRFVTPAELARHLRAAGLGDAGGQGARLQPAWPTPGRSAPTRM